MAVALKNPAQHQDLLRIAREAGVSANDILSCTENQDLFRCRDPGVLFTEDDIWVPEPKPKQIRISVGHSVYLVYKPAIRRLHLSLRDESGKPREVDYTLQDFAYDGTQKSALPGPIYGFSYQGVVDEELPAAVTKLTLLLEDDQEHPITLELGRLEPVSTTRGLRARLQSLGLYVGELSSDRFDEDLRHAVELFQRQHKLPVTGAADPVMREKLRAICGG